MTSSFTPALIIRERLNKLKISDFSRAHEKTEIIWQTFTPNYEKFCAHKFHNR